MIHEISALETPTWLGEVNENSAFPKLEEILTDSLFYPACGFNGTPVKFLSGNINSFVYCDYDISETNFLDNLLGDRPECGFKNYRPIRCMKVPHHDLLTNALPDQPEHYRGPSVERFIHWSVWERLSSAGPEAGAKRFSFLFFAGEMCEVYQSLYCKSMIAPRILALVQPGTMGGEWESVGQADSTFKKVVVSNTAGFPEYLLFGGFGKGFYETPCWSEYDGERIVQLPERYAGLWRIASPKK